MSEKMKKLRSGYTTGACAAAAAKGALTALLEKQKIDNVDIGFPDSSRHSFIIERCRFDLDDCKAEAAVKKDAGDDPDVTNGAYICAAIHIEFHESKPGDKDTEIKISGGKGVGKVTKPGLAVEVGQPAINPVPLQMIRSAVSEILDIHVLKAKTVEITISIPNGEELAEKTLNRRLGIIGGLSILGTTGIVRPVSADAWTATINASMDVARSNGLDEVVISTGRTSEAAVMKQLELSEEAFVMMGDYLHFSLAAARQHGFKHVHYAGMWAKVLKAAMEIPQTHVRHGALEVPNGIDLLRKLGVKPSLLDQLQDANTAREIYLRLNDAGEEEIIRKVCEKARQYCHGVSKLPVSLYLIDSSKKVVCHVS